MADQNDARPGDGTQTPPDRPRPAGACPLLGLADEASAHFDFPSSEHRCRATAPAYVELAHQGTYCLTDRHVSCARYTGPDAAPPVAPPVPWAFAATPGGSAAPPGAPATTPGGAATTLGGPATQPPPTARPAYPLAARGGFGALASTPRGWVPVETSSPGPAAAAAIPGGEPGLVPEPGQTPDAVRDTGAPPPVGAEGDKGADPEGLGALVAAAGIVAASHVGDGAAGSGPVAVEPGPPPTPEGATPADAEAPAGAPSPAAADTPTDAPAPADVEMPTDLAPGDAVPDGPGAEAAAAAGAATGSEAAAAAATGAAALEGPAALEGAAATTPMTARIAALGRGLLRAVVILGAVVLVLAALVGVGYVAGKLIVRPGESVPAVVPSAVPVTPGIAVPTPVGSDAPGAGAGASPSASGGSEAPAPSATAGATDRPVATPKPTPRPSPKPRVYVVKSGDTLFAIAQRFGVSVAAIIEANDIADPNAIYTGQRLTIPRP